MQWHDIKSLALVEAVGMPPIHLMTILEFPLSEVWCLEGLSPLQSVLQWVWVVSIADRVLASQYFRDSCQPSLDTVAALLERPNSLFARRRSDMALRGSNRAYKPTGIAESFSVRKY